MVNVETIRKIYPLHWLVWNNNHTQLEKDLNDNHDQYNLELRDNRGRTPLMLAVTLGHVDCAGVLLHHEADVNTENLDGWNVVQEAVGTGNFKLVQMVLARRDYQRYCNRVAGIPELLDKLKQAPDFYVEMKWEFTSWVPLASRMCPSDTYKVYKQGSNVRIDTTLLGFDQTSWQRGSRSYIFKGQNYVSKWQNDGATMMEVDHDTKKVYVEHIKLVEEDMQMIEPFEEGIIARLTNPIVTTYIDTDKISFERNKVGLWGWRSDKSEAVNGHECKVFSACNVELITKTRMEHLNEADKAKARAPRTALQSFLGIAEQQQQQESSSLNTTEEFNNVGNPSNITPEEYFDPEVDLNGRDIGRPKEVNTKIQKFKATLWLCENYPLSLQEQIMPIVDLMAITSSHFAKLKDFIQMQLPAGFPVKIEIPLFHVLNARITFGNIFGMDQEVPNVGRIQEGSRVSCLVDDTCFDVPPGYLKLGAELRTQYSIDEEDDLLQFAIQQSLLEAGSEKDEVDIWEALRAQKPSRPTSPRSMTMSEERELQRAIRASIVMYQESSGNTANDDDDLGEDDDNLEQLESATAEQLRLALRLSEQQQMEEEQRRLLEEETFRQVLELSLTDK